MQTWKQQPSCCSLSLLQIQTQQKCVTSKKWPSGVDLLWKKSLAKNKWQKSRSPPSPGATTTWCCLPFGLAIQIVSSRSRTNIGVGFWSPCGDIIGKLWTILAKDRPLGRPCLRGESDADVVTQDISHLVSWWSLNFTDHSNMGAGFCHVKINCTISLDWQNLKFGKFSMQIQITLTFHDVTRNSFGWSCRDWLAQKCSLGSPPSNPAKSQERPKNLEPNQKYMKHSQSYSHIPFHPSNPAPPKTHETYEKSNKQKQQQHNFHIHQGYLKWIFTSKRWWNLILQLHNFRWIWC